MKDYFLLYGEFLLKVILLILVNLKVQLFYFQLQNLNFLYYLPQLVYIIMLFICDHFCDDENFIGNFLKVNDIHDKCHGFYRKVMTEFS